MNDDDNWQQQARVHSHGGGAVQAVCYCDSTRELRGMIEQCWEEFAAGFDDAALADSTRALPFGRSTTGLRIDIDNGLEVSLKLYPVSNGEACDDSPLSAAQVLLQLHDDGGGSPDPVQLQALLEWLLEDLLPHVGQAELDSVAERFADGERPVLLTDITGQLLEMPPGMTDSS